MMVDLDQEEEVAAAATPKVQQEEPKALALDMKCDEPEEEDEITKLLGGDNTEEEPEEGDEADSSGAANGSALLSDKSCDDKVEEVVAEEQDATKPQEGTVEEVQKSASLAPMEDSPILGVLCKAEATESVIGMAEDGEGVAEWSPVEEMIVETNPDVEDNVEAISEVALKGDGFTVTDETVHPCKEIIPAATGEDEISEEDVTEEKDGSADEMQKSEEENEDETSDELDEDEESLDDDEGSEETDSTDDSEDDCKEVRTDFNNVKEELVQMMQVTAIYGKTSEDSAEEVSEEDGSADEASEDSAEETSEEDGSGEENDFSDDLPEFDGIVVLSDAETVSDTISLVKENQGAVACATKTSVKSLDDSLISINEEEVSEKKDVIDEAMKEVTCKVDTIVKSLDECTIKEGTQLAEEEKLNTRVEAVGQKDYSTMSMRKLRVTLKNQLAKAGKKHAEKRLPLEEVDDNACADC